VGVPRIVRAYGIPFPLGNPYIANKEVEKQIRYAVFSKAVEALKSEATGQPVLFWPHFGNAVDDFVGPVKDYGGMIPQ